MSPEIKLSFIIPVYNVEKYVQICIDSITRQYDETCEIILVDDGATDSSDEICDKNAGERVKVIHKANGGLSSARNEGLKYASGKYIAFVDSDDLIEAGSVKAILNWIDNNDADICFMQAIKFYPDGVEEPLGDDISSNSVKGLDPTEVIKYLSSRQKYPGSACTKMYRRAFFEENGINFPHDRRQSEDLGFTMNCLMKAKSFSSIDCPYYRYRQNREGSITNAVSEKAVDGLMLFTKESVEKLTTNKMPKDEKCKAAMSFAAYEYVVLLHNYAGLQREVKKKKKAEVNQLKWILKFGTTTKTKLTRVLSVIVGIDATAGMLRWAYNKRLAGK